jgi:hypothetical protein
MGSTLSVQDGEGFRMPSGVGKPPKHEPAGLRCWSMGISCFARLGWLRSRLGSAVGGGSVREIRRPAALRDWSTRERAAGWTLAKERQRQTRAAAPTRRDQGSRRVRA